MLGVGGWVAVLRAYGWPRLGLHPLSGVSALIGVERMVGWWLRVIRAYGSRSGRHVRRPLGVPVAVQLRIDVHIVQGPIGRCRARVTISCYILDPGYNHINCAPLFATADSLMGGNRRHGGRKHRAPMGMINIKPTSHFKCRDDLEKATYFLNDESRSYLSDLSVRLDS